jgi:hypothetical protein
MTPVFFPKTVGIELVRGRNLTCPMFPVTSNASAESQRFQFIDLALLQQLGEEIDRWPSIQKILFFHFGEPMAHPHFRRCPEILHTSRVARNAFVIQHTNASLLTDDKAQAILEIPVIKTLVFSFDGFGDRQSFERLRGPHYYDHVLTNIRAFAHEAKTRRPDLILATCTILPRENEVPRLDIPPRTVAQGQLDEPFGPLGISVETRDMHDYSGNDNLPISEQKPARVFGGCHFVEQDSLYFTVNGRAQPRCAVYSESFHVGHFPRDTFGALLNNDHMGRVRHALRMDRRADLPFC